MDITQLTDDELLTQVKKSAANERLASAQLVQDLAEVDRRFLFAKFGFDSLFRFCVVKLKMSDAQAARRVNAARLLQSIPQLKVQIETGEVAVTAASQLHSYCKREARAGNPVSSQKKNDLLEQIKSKSTRDVEKILAAKSSLPASLPKDREKTLTQEFTELRLIADCETMANVKRLREIWSHDAGSASLTELFKKMAKICVETFDPDKKAERATKRRAKTTSAKKAGVDRNSKRAEANEDLPNFPQNLAGHLSGNFLVNLPGHAPGHLPAKMSGTFATQCGAARDTEKTQVDTALDAHLQMDIDEWLEGLERTQKREPSDQDLNKVDAMPASKLATPAPKSEFQELQIEHPIDATDVNLNEDFPDTSQSSVHKIPIRYIPAIVRQEVWLRDGGSCSFLDPVSAEKCGSRTRVQYDHIVPFAMGGTHDVTNIRLSCHRHNQWHAIQTYGRAKIMRYSRSARH